MMMLNTKKYTAMAVLGVGLAFAATPASACGAYGYAGYGYGGSGYGYRSYGGCGAYGYAGYRRPYYGGFRGRPFALPHTRDFGDTPGCRAFWGLGGSGVPPRPPFRGVGALRVSG